MRQSAATLEAFYRTRLGSAARDRIAQRLVDLWGDCTGERVLGIGFPAPLLGLWQAEARSAIGVIVGEVGETRMQGPRGQVLSLVPEERLPFSEALFDKVFLLHALEESEQPRQLLREAWRVLAPEGRLVVAVANRKSLWSVNESKPFGHGRPWTRRQLINFVGDSLFQVTASTTAVHMPPLDWRLITAASKSWERAGEVLLPGLGGVVLVEATKRLYAKPGGSAAAPVTQAVKTGKARPALPRKLARNDEVKPPIKSRIDVRTSEVRTIETDLIGAGEL